MMELPLTPGISQIAREMPKAKVIHEVFPKEVQGPSRLTVAVPTILVQTLVSRSTRINSSATRQVNQPSLVDHKVRDNLYSIILAVSSWLASLSPVDELSPFG
jgi:hypothetical protein